MEGAGLIALIASVSVVLLVLIGVVVAFFVRSRPILGTLSVLPPRSIRRSIRQSIRLYNDPPPTGPDYYTIRIPTKKPITLPNANRPGLFTIGTPPVTPPVISARARRILAAMHAYGIPNSQPTTGYERKSRTSR